ncbi:MAG: DUF1559 domain-containing protein [Planctomycetota bacterium]
MACSNNVKQIGLGLANYHASWNSFPPAYTVDANGNRLHSWRTLILPYVEQQPLYDRIDLTKPWDDPAHASQLTLRGVPQFVMGLGILKLLQRINLGPIIRSVFVNRFQRPFR